MNSSMSICNGVNIRARVREKLVRATLTSLLSLQKEGEDVYSGTLKERGAHVK